MKPTRRLSRRKGSGKKGSARARNSKKLRGGVTRRRLSQLTQQELLVKYPDRVGLVNTVPGTGTTVLAGTKYKYHGTVVPFC